jgi:Phage integrase family
LPVKPPVPPSIAVYRSFRFGGDTKTTKSRRRLALPQRCVDVLRRHRERLPRPPAAGDFVFATARGTALDAHNVRRSFRSVVASAGLNPREWTPRDLRHSFMSLLSANGVRIEDISRLVGQSATGVTERVYRHQLHAVLDEGASVGDERHLPARAGSHSDSHSAGYLTGTMIARRASELGGAEGIRTPDPLTARRVSNVQRVLLGP